MSTDPSNILIGSGLMYMAETEDSITDTVGTGSDTDTIIVSSVATDDVYNGYVVELTGGSGKGQFRYVWDSIATTNALEVEPDLTTTPASGDGARLWPFTVLDGGFKDDLSIELSEDRYNVEIADALVHVKGVRTRLDVFVRFSMVESTLENLRKALGLPQAQKAAGGSGNNVLFITDEEQTDVVLKFIGNSSDGELKTWIFPKCRLATDLSMVYSKAGEVLIPVVAQVYGWKDGSDYGIGFCIDA